MSVVEIEQKTEMASWLRVVEQLCQSPDWPEDELPVEMKQTHISVLLLGRKHVICSSIVATLIASLLSWVLDRLGVDPAMASGPVATVLQDLLSVAIYLGIATAII
jgi:Mg/Co/Ni transporter MgtE